MSADIRHATHTGRGLLHSRTALMFFSICISVVYLRPLLKSNCIGYLEVFRENCCELMHMYFILCICSIVSSFFKMYFTF